MPISDYAVKYVARLVRATRPDDPHAPAFVKELIDWGAGPRAGQNLILGGKAMAAMDGRFSVSLDDIRKVAVPVLRHRISTNFQAQAEGQNTDDLIQPPRHRDPRARRPQVRPPRRLNRATICGCERMHGREALLMATDHRVLRLGPNDQGKLVSSDEFAGADGVAPWRYEREGGRLLVMSPDSKDHDDCSEPLRDHLGAFRLANPQIVEDVVSESWIRVGDGTDRIADIAVYLVPEGDVPERPDRAPEIVFEIVSA